MKAMPSMPPATSLGAASSKAAPPVGPPAKAMPKVKEKNEIKEELLEVKIESVESSEEDEVMECEEQPSHQLVGAHWSTPMRSRDWNPASPKFDHCTSGGRNQKKQR